MNGKTAKLLRKLALKHWLDGDRDPAKYRRYRDRAKRLWLGAPRKARAGMRENLRAAVW